MLRLIPWAFIPLILMLTGCMSVTPRGLLHMAGFNPLTVNPEHLAAGLGVPQTIRLLDGNAIIAMSYRLEGAEATVVDERFLLQISDASAIAGAPTPRPGERIYIGRLSALDVARMRDAQNRIRAYKAQGAKGQGMFSISLRGGCTTAFPVTGIPFRTFVRTGSQGSFTETTRPTDFVSTLPRNERDAFLRSVKVCADAG